MSQQGYARDSYNALEHTSNVQDPGASGVITPGQNELLTVCEVTTAGAETRTLDPASNWQVGKTIEVYFITDGGDLTIDTEDADVVLDDAGDFAQFKVVNNDGTREWRNTATST